MSKNERMTITEFLEARIAEDESRANAWQSKLDDLTIPAYMIGGTLNPARVLAECAAKRRMLAFDKDEQIWSPRGFSSDTDAEAFVSGGPKDPQARHITRILAMVYADHPDYQPEWAV